VCVCVKVRYSVLIIHFILQRLAQIQWLEEVKSLQDDPKSVSREEVAKLIEKGMTIPPHVSIENTLSELHALTKAIDKWEEKAKMFLNTKTRRTIAAVEEFIREADEVEAYLPSLDILQDTLNKAKNWTKLIDDIRARENGAREVKNPVLRSTSRCIRDSSFANVCLSSSIIRDDHFVVCVSTIDNNVFSALIRYFSCSSQFEI